MVRVCFLSGVLLLSSLALASSEEEEVTVETIKHEDDIVYLTPDHHPDVYFSDHFDHQVGKRYLLFLLVWTATPRP
jgi:hypothetical protein